MSIKSEFAKAAFFAGKLMFIATVSFALSGPAHADVCNVTTGAVPPVMFSLDFIDPYSGYIVYQFTGSGMIASVLDPSGTCVYFADQWFIEPPIRGGRAVASPYLDQWVFWDSGAGPFFLSYPMFAGAAVNFFAIDLTNGDVTVDGTLIGLFVDYAFAF